MAFQYSPASSSASSTPRSQSAPSSAFAEPFDNFKHQAGSANTRIFRLFKIRHGEEIGFFMNWIRPGIFSRDGAGALEFRVSSADPSELTQLGIGEPDESYGGWSQYYDDKGVSWLTQLHGTRCHERIISIPDANSQIIEWDGRIGRYGPSGLTPTEFFMHLLQKEPGNDEDSDKGLGCMQVL